MFNIRSKGFTMSGGALTTVFLSSPMQCSANPSPSFCEYLKKCCCCCPGLFEKLYRLCFGDNGGYNEVSKNSYRSRYENESYSRNIIGNQETTSLRKSKDSDEDSDGENNNIDNNKYYDNESEKNNNISNNKHSDSESEENNNINNKYSGGEGEEEEEEGETKGYGNRVSFAERITKLKKDEAGRRKVFFGKMNEIYRKKTGNSLTNDSEMYSEAEKIFSSFKSGDNFDEFCKQSCEQFMVILKNSKENIKFAQEGKFFTNDVSYYG